jgi:hypothetical protein
LLAGFVMSLPSFDRTAQAVKLVSAAFIMGLITMQSRKFARLRERVVSERRDLAAAQLELERVTRHDALTGLLSRLYGRSVWTRNTERSQLTGRHLWRRAD